MEIRASYVLVGAFVLAVVAALVGFAVWLAADESDRAVDVYRVAFGGSVSGLQVGGEVRYRGIPVGRVTDLRIDPDNIERVIATVELRDQTPVKEDTVAALELQGVTGIAYIQLTGGSAASPPLEPRPAGPPPVIPASSSALEQVFESTPQLLNRGVELAERLTGLFDERNMAAIRSTLASVERLASGVAAREDEIDRLLLDAGEVTAGLNRLTADLSDAVVQFEGEGEAIANELTTTLDEIEEAANELSAAANSLSRLGNDLREPLNDFAGTGLYEFSQLIGETRVLVAALSRIVTEIERDPANFFLGSRGQGFRAQ